MLTTTLLLTLLLVVFGYLAGSISTAILVCRAMGLPDPRSEGSRNHDDKQEAHIKRAAPST